MDELEPTGVVGPLKAGMRIVRGVQRWIEGPDRASLYRDHYEEWVADLADALRAHASDVEALAERLDVFEQDRERVLTLGNYGHEAWREANDARRRMLGDAALATIFSELSAAELARAERTIRMLDPEDLPLLRALEGGEYGLHGRLLDPENPYSRVHMVGVPEELHATLMAGHLEGAALVASGCVWTDGATAKVTALGRLVLRFMGIA